jgi:hypothetical protein
MIHEEHKETRRMPHFVFFVSFVESHFFLPWP